MKEKISIFTELTKEELQTIEGGSKIKDAIKSGAEWLGEKVGEAMNFLSRLDWTGSPLGY